jgi:ATP-dependent DNA helicase DinG
MPNTVFSFDSLRKLQRKIFTEILPLHGFPAREKQTEMAEEILDALCDLKVLLAEAEVGTGKTLAYLLPAALLRRGRANEGRIGAVLPDGHSAPILVATSSIALQRALVRDHIPALSDILIQCGIIQKPLTAALRKGKGNYICERRLAHFIRYANPQTKAIVTPLLSGAQVDLAAAQGLTPYMRRNIRIDEHCSRDCPSYGVCRYTRLIREMNRGGFDFQVTNHNLFIADLQRRAQNRNSPIPEYQAVILDEGHKFLDAARDMYGVSLSLPELTRIMRDVKGFTFMPGLPTADITREADRIFSKGRLLFQLLGKEVPAGGEDGVDRYAAKIRERSAELIQSIAANVSALADMLNGRTVTAKFERQCGDILRSLSRISGALDDFAKHEDLVYWLEGSGTPPAGGAVLAASGVIEGAGTGESRPDTLRGIPKNLGGLLLRDLWSKDIPIILTSGTLSAAGSYGHKKKKMGLDRLAAKRLRETTKPSPFNHRENTLLYISENTPFPDNNNARYIESVADEAERLIRASHGHAALLFTSYKAMDMVYERIAAKGPPYPLFRLDRGGAAAIELFKRSGNGVLFASGALWEGIDIPGDILSMLIIVRLPFAVPDPVSEWERTLYPSMCEYKKNVIVPEMLVKLKQGFGRLIRSEDDTGCVAILDSRASEGGTCRRRVLAALPPCRVTASINDVARFMRAKKLPGYFA